jgi:glycosyltransferase involved in cell wall biosynthesis
MLPFALEALAREPVDVVVVDNGSTDASVAVAERFGATVARCERQGVSYARNAGLALVRTPLMLSLDADCVPRSGWAGRLVDALAPAGDDVVGVAGRTVPRPHPDRWSQRPEVTPHPALDEHGQPLYAVGGNACYRTELLRELGGFPPFGADDAALGAVARAAGLRFVSEPGAVVEHANPIGVRGYVRQMRKVGGYWGELDPEAIGGAAWWAGRARHALGAARGEADPVAAVVRAAASLASTLGAFAAARP